MGNRGIGYYVDIPTVAVVAGCADVVRLEARKDHAPAITFRTLLFVFAKLAMFVFGVVMLVRGVLVAMPQMTSS